MLNNLSISFLPEDILSSFKLQDNKVTSANSRCLNGLLKAGWFVLNKDNISLSNDAYLFGKIINSQTSVFTVFQILEQCKKTNPNFSISVKELNNFLYSGVMCGLFTSVQSNGVWVYQIDRHATKMYVYPNITSSSTGRKKTEKAQKVVVESPTSKSNLNATNQELRALEKAFNSFSKSPDTTNLGKVSPNTISSAVCRGIIKLSLVGNVPFTKDSLSSYLNGLSNINSRGLPQAIHNNLKRGVEFGILVKRDKNYYPTKHFIDITKVILCYSEGKEISLDLLSSFLTDKEIYLTNLSNSEESLIKVIKFLFLAGVIVSDTQAAKGIEVILNKALAIITGGLVSADQAKFIRSNVNI